MKNITIVVGILCMLTLATNAKEQPKKVCNRIVKDSFCHIKLTGIHKEIPVLSESGLSLKIPAFVSQTIETRKPGNQTANRIAPDSATDKTIKFEMQMEPVHGYAVSYIRADEGIYVECEDNSELICYTIDPITHHGCIDPNGNNPNIGPTNFSPEERNGSYFEIVEQNGECVLYLLYTVPGSQKRGGGN
jgi:hypothetical protein